MAGSHLALHESQHTAARSTCCGILIHRKAKVRLHSQMGNIHGIRPPAEECRQPIATSHRDQRTAGLGARRYPGGAGEARVEVMHHENTPHMLDSTGATSTRLRPH